MKYKVIPYMRVEPFEEELFDNEEDARNSYNEIDNQTIFIIEQIEVNE